MKSIEISKRFGILQLDTILDVMHHRLMTPQKWRLTQKESLDGSEGALNGDPKNHSFQIERHKMLNGSKAENAQNTDTV